MGPSGSGKSTLLYILGALEPPTSGTVTLDGTQSLSRCRRRNWRRFAIATIGFVFQDHCLLPQCSVLENVLIPTLVAKAAAISPSRARASCSSRWGLADRLDHRPAELSGGEKQRAALARALDPAPAPAALRRADRQPRRGLGRASWRRCCSICTAARTPSWSSSPTAPSWPRGSRGGTNCVMRISTLLARSLAWYWRTNAGGAARASPRPRRVLGGALLVGDSVRASLRDLVLAGSATPTYVVTRDGFFREELASALAGCRPADRDSRASWRTRRAGGAPAACRSTAIDERFWQFQGDPGEPPRGREVLLTAALARELGGQPAATPSCCAWRSPRRSPWRSLHGRKEDIGKTIRLALSGVARREFSLQPQQGEVRAAYVPLARLQRDLGQPGKVNTILAADAPGIERALKQRYALADLGLRLRVLARTGLPVARKRQRADQRRAGGGCGFAPPGRSGLRTEPVLTYLANSMRAGGREIPYSLVTALDSAPRACRRRTASRSTSGRRAISARRRATRCELDYYVWKSDGRLRTETAHFRVETHRADRRGRRRPRFRARLPGHHRIQEPARLGPAVPAQPGPHPPHRRTVLGTATAPRPRRSCVWRGDASFGVRASGA